MYVVNQQNILEIKNLVFGDYLNDSSHTSNEIFTKIFLELMKSKERFWNYYPQIGICYFQKHILINFNILCPFISESIDSIISKMKKDAFTAVKIPNYLEEAMRKQFGDMLNSWKLYKIPITNSSLYTLMQNVKTPSIEEFNRSKEKPLLTRFSIQSDKTNRCNTISFEPVSNMTDNYAEYYISLVPPEANAGKKCWLFSTTT